MSKIIESINAAQEKQNRSNGNGKDDTKIDSAAINIAVPSKSRETRGIANYAMPILIIILIILQAASFLWLTKRAFLIEKKIEKVTLLMSSIDSKGNDIENSLKSGFQEIVALKDQSKSMQEKVVSLDQKLENTILSYKSLTLSVDKLIQSSRSNADYLTVLDKRMDDIVPQETQLEASGN